MYKDLKRLKELYGSGSNIIEYLKQDSSIGNDSSLSIAISYDLQAGNYINNTEENPEYIDERTSVYSSILNQLGSYKTILEAGVGEATTLGNLLPKLNHKGISAGFDLSYSRIKYAEYYLDKVGMSTTDLYVGDLFNAPFEDDSIDIIYTNHTLEPNGGQEKEALEALYRIARNYIVLFEPIYELANDITKAHMEKHGYVRNLYSYALELGYKVIEYKLMFDSNPYNPNNTGVIIIEKSNVNSDSDDASFKLACPVTKRPLMHINGNYYCQESMLLYPVVDQIPCLLPNNAIIATHYLDKF